MHRANLQRRAVTWITNSGGRASYGYQLNLPPKADPQPSGPDWLRGILGIDYFESVKVVRLSRRPVADVSLLAGLTSVKTVYLDGTSVVDLAPLSELQRLEYLWLARTSVVDLKALSKLRSLEHLDLSVTDISDVSPLANLRLKTLRLHFTEVSDVTPLASIPSLEILDLTDTLVREEDYRSLQSQLRNCRIDWNANRFN